RTPIIAHRQPTQKGVAGRPSHGSFSAVDESTYQKVVAKTFRAIEDALEPVDPDVIELSNTGDVLTLTFKSGVRCVLNTQRPVRQLWMAAKDTAWHFN